MFNSYFQKRQNLHGRNLRDKKKLHVSVGYSAMALLTTKVNGTKVRKKLSLEIKKSDDVVCSKEAVKSHFINSYT